MNLFNNIVNSSTDMCNYISANKPKILSIGSSILTVASVGTTAYATWKFKDKVDEHNDILQALHAELANAKSAEEETEIRNRIMRQYGYLALTGFEHYFVPAALMGGAIACDVASSKEYENKLAIATTVALLSKSALDRAKERAIEQLGEEDAEKLFYDIKEEKIETIDEKGKKKIETKKIYDPYGVGLNNPFAYLVGEGIDSNFSGTKCDHDLDLHLYYSVLENTKRKLMIDGSVCLWDVYTSKNDGFGIDPKTVSKDTRYLWHHSGWIKDEKKNQEYIDTCREMGIQYDYKVARDLQKVSFGIDEKINEAWNNGKEPLLYLLPNCIANYEDFLYPND